jgi:hypothetical protein
MCFIESWIRTSNFVLLLSMNSLRGDWETKWSVPWFDCDESLTCRYLNSNSGHFVSFTFISVSFEESRLLVSWCAGYRCGMTCNDDYHDKSRRSGAEDREWSHKLGTRWPGDREVGWRRVWSAPCTWRWETRVSWLSLKTKVDGLSVVWPQNHWDDFLWFDLKIGGLSFSVWASKPASLI